MHYLNSTQEALAQALLAHDTIGVPFLGNGGMGVGKTCVAFEKALQWQGMVAYAHPTHALADQAFPKEDANVITDFERAGLTREQIGKFPVMSAYVSLTRLKRFNEQHGLQLEASEGELVESVLERYRFANLTVSLRVIARGICLRNEPTIHPNEYKQYYADKIDLSQRKVVICTITTMLLDAWTENRYSGLPYTYAIIDEGHEVYRYAKLLFDRSVCEDDFEWLGGDQSRFKKIDASSLAYAKTRALARKDEDHTRAMELYAVFSVMEKHLDKEGAFYFGMKAIGGCWRLEFRNPARILRRLFERVPTAFLSGTLSVTGDLTRFANIIGAKQWVGDFFAVPRFGQARFFQALRMNEQEAQEYLSAKEQGVHLRYKADLDLAVASAKHASKTHANVLVLTTNTADTIALGERLHCTYQLAGENMANTVARYQGGILISHGAWEGMDIKGYRFGALIITKVPYPPPSEVLDMSFGEYQEWVIRKLKQGLGRGLRSEDAICDYWLLDKRFPLHGSVCARYGVSNRLMEHHLRLDLAIPTHLRDDNGEDIFSEFGWGKATLISVENNTLKLH